jgi:hypothetical protein
MNRAAREAAERPGRDADAAKDRPGVVERSGRGPGYADRETFVSVTTLAAAIGRSERTVRRALSRLYEAGEVTPRIEVTAWGRRNVYKLSGSHAASLDGAGQGGTPDVPSGRALSSDLAYAERSAKDPASARVDEALTTAAPDLVAPAAAPSRAQGQDDPTHTVTMTRPPLPRPC